MRIENLNKNHQIIYHKGNIWFFSYGTLIYYRDDTGMYLDENKWDYSKTTGKYRNKILLETKPETMLKIKNGIYKLTNLNNGEY